MPFLARRRRLTERNLAVHIIPPFELRINHSLKFDMCNQKCSAFDIYDSLWKQFWNESFLGRCIRLKREMRIIRRPFKKVPKTMVQVTDWTKMCRNYKEYIPDLVSMLDYIVRITFRALLGEQYFKFYNLYVRHMKPESCITQAVAEALEVSRRESTEKRTARAILYSTFNQRQVAVIVEEIQQAVENIKKRNGEALCSTENREQASNGTGTARGVQNPIDVNATNADKTMVGENATGLV